MRRYLQEVRSRPTHDRRLFAMRIAGALTAIIFVAWIGTLGLRVGGSPAQDVATTPDNASQTAAAQNIFSNQNQLIVATSTY